MSIYELISSNAQWSYLGKAAARLAIPQGSRVRIPLVVFLHFEVHVQYRRDW